MERFQPTSGRFSGFLGLATAAVIVAIAVNDRSVGTPLGVAILATLGALLVWIALLRPALWATSRDLVVRGMFRTDTIPLAAITRVSIGQILAIFVGEQRYMSPVVGYTARQTMTNRLVARGGGEADSSPAQSHQTFVEARIDHLAQTSRDLLGIRKGSPEQEALAADVRRTYAWPEIVGVAVLSLAFVVWLLA